MYMGLAGEHDDKMAKSYPKQLWMPCYSKELESH
jgi:hypothetical protein